MIRQNVLGVAVFVNFSQAIEYSEVESKAFVILPQTDRMPKIFIGKCMNVLKIQFGVDHLDFPNWFALTQSRMLKVILLIFMRNCECKFLCLVLFTFFV